MSTLPEAASVAPATVTKVSRGEVDPPARPRRSNGRRVLATPVVTDMKANPVVWRRALQLAGGDARRLRVDDAGTILVVNR